MIVCPFCKEEIDDGSHYCDQCGNQLLYCSKCGSVGMGRRCTHCGGLMVTAEEIESENQQTVMSNVMSSQPVHHAPASDVTASRVMPEPVPLAEGMVLPQLMLVNNQLNIRIQGVNGAIIGRRQGPYRHVFEQNRYVSGVHAQLFYNQGNGWCVMDKNSSNGTMLNNQRLHPEAGVKLKNGDILVLANVSLQVIIKK